MQIRLKNQQSEKACGKRTATQSARLLEFIGGRVLDDTVTVHVCTPLHTQPNRAWPCRHPHGMINDGTVIQTSRPPSCPRPAPETPRADQDRRRLRALGRAQPPPLPTCRHPGRALRTYRTFYRWRTGHGVGGPTICTRGKPGCTYARVTPKRQDPKPARTRSSGLLPISKSGFTATTLFRLGVPRSRSLSLSFI